MQTKGQRETRQYPQSVGNLAIADESLGVFQPPNPRPAPGETGTGHAEDEIHALAPTKGILNGIRLSLTLWGPIGAIILTIGELLAF